MRDPQVDSPALVNVFDIELEPRAGVPSGHVPTALNIPFQQVLNANGTFKPVQDLQRVFNEVLAQPGKDIVTMCGSGVTAATLIFALELCGVQAKLYDGSWTDYATRPGSIIKRYASE